MCKLRDDTMSQAGELPLDFRTNVEKEWEKKMEDRTMFREPDNLSGPAVRSEAVAWAVTAQRGGIHKLSITKDSADRKAAAWREEWPDNGCRVRPLVFGDASPDLRGAGVREAMPHPAFDRGILYTDFIQGEQVRRDDLWAITTTELKTLLSARAADALDSQPTSSTIKPDQIALIQDMLIWPVTEDDARTARDMLQEMHFDLSMASSQPTDGGVRNG